MEFDVFPQEGEEIERLKTRLDAWLESVPKWHAHFVWSPNEVPAWAEPVKPLSQSKVALVTSAGIYLTSQKPFDVESEYGDWSFREIPSNANPDDLKISDTHYDHSEADLDINCLFPITHLLTLKSEGVIAEVASNHYGFMGYVPDPVHLVRDTAPEVAQRLLKDEVDIVFLTPG